jgi:hypothetical protein
MSYRTAISLRQRIHVTLQQVLPLQSQQPSPNPRQKKEEESTARSPMVYISPDGNNNAASPFRGSTEGARRRTRKLAMPRT